MPYEWLQTAFAVLALFDIEPHEVMQVLYGSNRRPVPAVDPATGLRMLTIWGRTRSRRALIVTVKQAGGYDILILGARDMTASERKEYEQWEITR